MSQESGALRLFKDIRIARFVNRPNRFIIECLVKNNKIRAYLPNPGRLWELLLPGARIYLEKNTSIPGRSTGYSCVAAEKDGIPVMLHTHYTNTVVQWLMDGGKIPSFEGYRIVRPEVTHGSSRFDFLLKKDNKELVLEVKSCTLFGNSIAMFPDAMTLRGRKHLNELANLSRNGVKSAVIFLVHSINAQYFMPEYHTDLAFSQTLYDVRKKILIKPLALRWRNDLTPDENVKEIEIPWTLIGREAHDRGDYLLILKMRKARSIHVGALGKIHFNNGYYIYVGSAMKDLSRRIRRHERTRKRCFWHIDYLRDKADFIAAIPVRTSTQLECEIAEAVNAFSDRRITGFGSSGCACETHLFGMKINPLTTPSFMKCLQYFRIDRLENELMKLK